MADDTPPELPPLFGVQMYGGTGKTSTYFDPLIESGAAWLRAPITWRSVEPANVTPDQYNWVAADSVVAVVNDAKALNRQITLILTIEHAPQWAATHPDSPIDKVDISEFTAFVGALVERYDGDGIDDAPGSPVVTYFEFYNEPDRFCGGTFSWGADGDKYAAMLKAVYPVVKAANPNAQVVFGGIAYDWFSSVDKTTRTCNTNGVAEWPVRGGGFAIEFLDDVLAAGGGDYFDVMNFHFYELFKQNWVRFSGSHHLSIGLYEKTRYIREKLASYGVEDKPIMITEAGTASNGDDFGDPTKTPESQAQYVVIFFVQAMSAKVQSLIWWLLYDFPLAEFQYQNGLVTLDGVEKPAFKAYQILVAELGKATFERMLTPAETGTSLQSAFPTLEAYKFSDPANNRDVYVAWLNPFWGCGEVIKESKPLTFITEQAAVRDIYGQAQTVTDADDGIDDGQTRVPISCDAVYIEVDQSATVLQSTFLPYTVRQN